ncbi:RING-H2 finger protein ATL3-like [Tasmannia lanceolata]|uniref:RING-H2 finger protein ATL3-like n=1 Tax=Tasmannia lanceolata TaxID=3420 RepID=UPI004063C78B
MSGYNGDGPLANQDAIAITSKVMVAAIIVLFFTVVFVIFLHLYAKWFWHRRNADGSRSRSRRRFNFAADQALAPRHGLEPSVIRSLPVVMFQSKEFKDGLECAVCLCELSDGEKARLLPKCNHGFHLDCIDMWFQSHSTCPLCRSPVAPPSSNPDEIQVPEATNQVDGVRNFPTNVLFWGSQDQVSAGRSASEEGASSSIKPGGNGMLVIEIPRRVAESFSSSSSPSVRLTEDEFKSPTPTRLRSLKRLLSREKRVAPSSPTVGDIEQGVGGSVLQSTKMPMDS